MDIIYIYLLPFILIIFTDPELLEPVSMSFLKQNKHFLKLIGKYNKDLDALHRKNEKVRINKPPMY